MGIILWGGEDRGGRKEGGGKDTDSLETKEQREVRNPNLFLLKTNGCTRSTYLNLFQKHDKLSSSSIKTDNGFIKPTKRHLMVI